MADDMKNTNNNFPNNTKNAGKAGAQAAESALNAGADATRKMADQAGSFFSQGQASFERLSQDAAAQGREAIDSLIKTTNALASGSEELLKTCATLSRSAAEKNLQGVKELMGVRSLSEFTAMQSRLSRDSMDGMLSGLTQMSEIVVRLTTQSLEPLNDQFGKSFRKMTAPLAA